MTKPFLKYVGGKQKLLDQLLPLFPNKFETYFEPMCGSAAVCLALNPERAFLCDVNWNVCNVFEQVQNNVLVLINLLKEFKESHSKEFYYTIRNLDRLPFWSSETSDLFKAARYLYLNKTSYNGLWRENKKGQMNAPIGSYKNPNICNEERLIECSEQLRYTTQVKCMDYTNLDQKISIEPRDFIYFDPPYDPLSKTANFTGYTGGQGFDQDAFANYVKDLSGNYNCKIAVSNSWTEDNLERYKDFHIHEIWAKRSINSDANKRGAIREILATNYKP